MSDTKNMKLFALSSNQEIAQRILEPERHGDQESIHD